jgi:hypothetical protein
VNAASLKRDIILTLHQLERRRLDLVAPLMPAAAVMAGEHFKSRTWRATLDNIPHLVRLLTMPTLPRPEKVDLSSPGVERPVVLSPDPE